MFYLIPIPLVFVAVIVKIVSTYYDLKFFNIISSIIIIVGVLFFIYFYLDYHGINLLEMAKNILPI